MPSVFWDRTTRRVMTQEWVEGLKINQLSELDAQGFDRAHMAKVMVGAFADQIFRSGFVHGDPHPGNMFVRWVPDGRSRRQQLVCLDHGMYTEFSSAFRTAYCDLWQAMVLSDMDAMKRICESWGVADSEMFASMQLMKPFSRKRHASLNATTQADMVAHAVEMRDKGYDRAKSMLKDADKTPEELVILGRHLNIVRANNAAMGAPVNRVSIMAHAAAREASSLGGPLGGRYSYWVFRLRLFVLEAAFHIVQWRAKVVKLFGGEASNFEDLMQEQMKENMARLGIKLNMAEGETWEEKSGA